jgi:hypothetical protein
MDRPQLSLHLGVRAAALVLALEAPAAFAQGGGPPPVAPGTTWADVAPAPGLPGPQSVNPAPGAQGPYAGHTEHAFYDVNGRIADVGRKIGARLTGETRKKAEDALASIRAEEASQIARHGSLLDWARENLNHRLDLLLQAYPEIDG